MTIEALYAPSCETSLDFQKESAFDDFANKRGMEVQQNLCGILRSLDYVLGVRETEKDSPEDRQKIDIVVSLDQSKKDLVISEVYVQAKASTTGVATFNHNIMRILKSDEVGEKMSREEWMLKNNIVLLVGDLHISRSRKNRWPITDEEIITSFETQLEKIDNYERSKLHP